MELKQQLSTVQAEMQDVTTTRDSAIANEEAARQDSQTQAKLAQEVGEYIYCCYKHWPKKCVNISL